MTKEQITEDVYKKLRLSVGDDIRGDIQRGIISSPLSPLTILSLPTGFGKSFIALNWMIGKKTLVVISQLHHEENWIKESIKWNIDISNVTFVCYNSLKKYIDESWDLVCYDEGHRWSEMWTDVHLSIETKYTIVLSATIPDATMKKIYGIHKPKIWHLSLESAVEWGVLPEPTIYLVNLTLDNTRYDQIYIKGRAKDKETISCTFEEFNSKWKYTKAKRPNIHVICTQKQYYDLITEDLEWAKEKYFTTRDKNMERRFIMLGGMRKKYLAKLKTKIGSELIRLNQDKRIVVFAYDIEQATMYCKDAVHSKNKTGQQIINEFNEYKRDLLVSVRQLQESLNLSEPEVGIIIQINNSKKKGNSQVSTYNSQALGRIIRAFTPVLYLPVFKDTQDEEYFKKFKESLNPKWFKNYTT